MAKAKPFQWIGDNENKVLWLNTPDGKVPVTVVSPNGIVRKDENLTGITLEWQEIKKAQGLLRFLDLGERLSGKDGDGTVTDDDGRAPEQTPAVAPLTEAEQNLAQDTLNTSIATSKAIEKNNKVAADKALEQAITASDEREKNPALNEGVGAK